MVSKLLKFIPPHRIYVEPFGGGASLLFAKKPSPVEVYNDLDSGLVNFFRVIRDPELFKRFYKKIILTPYSREEFNYCKNSWMSIEDPVERAYRWFVVARMSFGGMFSKSWGFSLTASIRGMSESVSKWLLTIDKLPEISTRLLRVQIEHYDFRKIFETYDTKDTFFYCDPPYVSETRSGGKYDYEMSHGDHEELLQILIKIKGKVLLSCYDHKMYNILSDLGWISIKFNTACYAAAKTRATKIQGSGSALKRSPRTEVLYMNYRNLNGFIRKNK